MKNFSGDNIKSFEDQILSISSQQKLKAASIWLKNNGKQIQNVKAATNSKLINVILFYGDNSFVKTDYAKNLANCTNRGFYCVDLTKVISKYIGETEKNLDKLFSDAEVNNQVLFFDEADALFGKRTDVKDSHDRYANLEVDYLLKKIENYSSLVILSSKKKQNIDDGFTRRLRYVIYFRKPVDLK